MSEQPDPGTLAPHATIPGWLVDPAGNVYAREREFGCPNHPYGPPRDVDDEHTAVEWIARCLLDELDTEAIKTVAPGVTREQIEQAREDLGMCCRGRRWRDTGRYRTVGAFEIFVTTHRANILGPMRDALSGSILLGELARGTQLPRSAAAQAAIRIPLIHSDRDTTTDD